MPSSSSNGGHMPKGPRGKRRPADVVALVDAREAPVAKRGSYKPRAAKVEISN